MLKHIDRNTNTYSVYKLRPSTSLTLKLQNSSQILEWAANHVCFPQLSIWIDEPRYFQMGILSNPSDPSTIFSSWYILRHLDWVLAQGCVCQSYYVWKKWPQNSQKKLFLGTSSSHILCLSLYKHLHKIDPHEFIIKF